MAEYPPPYVERRWDDARRALGAMTTLLAVVATLLVAGIVLGILGYNLITDRLDNIERYTGQTANELQQGPTP